MQNLCGMTREEIIKAASIMKHLCIANECEDCPFGYDNGDCKIEDKCPCDWTILTDSYTWKAIS